MECSMMRLLVADKESHHHKWRTSMPTSKERLPKVATRASMKRVCDQGRPDKAHGHPEARSAKTRSFVYRSYQSPSSWLTLMISASEAKTKSSVYGQRFFESQPIVHMMYLERVKRREGDDLALECEAAMPEADIS
ncbi:uncharacterized protein G2W53_042331 [Senna tora]|uniref:Uncharacterized protein n=1 Tax=Senna tora TaxID=362788 RepID=A0A834SIM3_9FABA|nr:uncharacterized protein G2W53_042331 [Senna tora]